MKEQESIKESTRQQLEKTKQGHMEIAKAESFFPRPTTKQRAKPKPVKSRLGVTAKQPKKPVKMASFAIDKGDQVVNEALAEQNLRSLEAVVQSNSCLTLSCSSYPCFTVCWC